MEKAIFNKSGMKQIINSGYKLFDNQTNYIGTGNVIANTQISSFIRPYNEIENCGYIGKPGQFMNYDMQNFKRVSRSIEKIIYDKDRKESVILYEFCTWKDRQKNIIGYVLTDNKHNLIDYSVNNYYGSNWIEKKFAAIREAMKYICN